MSEYVKFATTAADQFISSMAEAQDAFLKSMTPYSEWASSVPQMPSAKFAPEMPTLAEITEANFAFANKFLKQQKKFAEKLFSVSTPES
jgi:hypothetical protein